MRRRSWSALVLVAMVAALTGCGIQATDPLPFGEPAGGIEIGTQMYFLLDGKIFPTLRRIDSRDPVDAVNLLAAGPTPEEQAAGLTTEVPAGIRLIEGAQAAPAPQPSADTDVQVALFMFGTRLDPNDLSTVAVTQLACTAVGAYRRAGLQIKEIILIVKGGDTRRSAGCPASTDVG
jgi:hypothetical protein